MSKAEDSVQPNQYEALRRKIEDCSIPVPECSCWIWLKAGDKNDYGSVYVGGGMAAKVHRMSYIVYNQRPIPMGLDVIHKCDTACCVNPDTPDRYEALIRYEGRDIYLGTYGTPEEASAVAVNKKMELLGEEGL